MKRLWRDTRTTLAVVHHHLKLLFVPSLLFYCFIFWDICAGILSQIQYAHPAFSHEQAPGNNGEENLPVKGRNLRADPCPKCTACIDGFTVKQICTGGWYISKVRPSMSVSDDLNRWCNATRVQIGAEWMVTKKKLDSFMERTGKMWDLSIASRR